MAGSPEFDSESTVILKISSRLEGIWREIANRRGLTSKDVAQAILHKGTKLADTLEIEGGELIYKKSDGTELKVPFFGEGDWEEILSKK